MWSILTADTNRDIEPGDELDLSGRTPLVLLGSDASPAVLRGALSSVFAWRLPLIEGELSGAQCVWAASLTAGGTPAATLMAGGRCLATLIMASDEELSALQQSFDLQAVRPAGCSFTSEDESFEQPLVLAPFEGILTVDGHPRSVASAALSGSAEPMMMIEVADLICSRARERGLEIYSPADLQAHKASEIIGDVLVSASGAHNITLL